MPGVTGLGMGRRRIEPGHLVSSPRSTPLHPVARAGGWHWPMTVSTAHSVLLRAGDEAQNRGSGTQSQPDWRPQESLGLGKGALTCELKDLVIKVGHGLVMHDLAPDDKLQASCGQEMVHLGDKRREQSPVRIAVLEGGCGDLPPASLGAFQQTLTCIHSARATGQRGLPPPHQHLARGCCLIYGACTCDMTSTRSSLSTSTSSSVSTSVSTAMSTPNLPHVHLLLCLRVCIHSF